MTIQNVIDYIQETVHPSDGELTDDMIVTWLNLLDGRVQTELMLVNPDAVTRYTITANRNTALLISGGFDKLYLDWVLCQIDYVNGEFQSYQNRLAMFNEIWDDYKCWYINRYHPADTDDTTADTSTVNQTLENIARGLEGLL